MADMFSVQPKGINAFRRKLQALYSADKLGVVFKRGEFVTMVEARKRLDRYIAQAMGVPLQNVKGLTPIYVKTVGFTGARVTSEFGIGKTTGFNLAIYSYKVMQRRGKQAGVRVMGGSKNPYKGVYPNAFPVKGHWKVSNAVYTDALLVDRKENDFWEFMETESPRDMLRNAGSLQPFSDYTQQRFFTNIRRQVNGMYRQLVMSQKDA